MPQRDRHTANAADEPALELAAASGQVHALLDAIREDGTRTPVISPRGGLMRPVAPVSLGLFPSKQITNHQTMQSGTTFFYTGDGSAVADTSMGNYLQGSQAILLSTLGNGSVHTWKKTALSAINMTGREFVVWLMLEDPSLFSSVGFYAGDTALANFYSWQLVNPAGTTTPYQYFKGNKWTKLVLNFADAIVTGSPTRSALTDFQFRFVDANTGAPARARINGYGSQVAGLPTTFPNGVVSLTFDDGWASVYTEARKKMDDYGFAGTVYAISDQIDQSGRMTTAQLKLLREKGWEIASHAYTIANHNLNFANITMDPDLESELNNLKDWIAEGGYDGMGIAYPQGAANVTVLDKIRKHYAYGRSTFDGQFTHYTETLPPGQPLFLRSRAIQKTDATATITAKVDAAYANLGWLILTFHDIVAAPVAQGTEYSIANFGTIIDYLNTKGIPVLPVRDVLRLCAKA